MTPPAKTMMSSAPWALRDLTSSGSRVLWQGGNAEGVHVVFDGLAGGFFRCLEEGAHVDVKAEVSKGRGDHLGAPVVTVLAELGDHYARAAAFFFGKFGDVGLDGFPAFLSFHNTSVNA